jgi:MFS family permease
VNKSVLADRNLRVLLAGQTVNMLGNSAMTIVLGIWVKNLTGSSGQAGLVFLVLTATAFLAPVSGLIVDRFPRRRVLIVNDSLTGLVIALLLLVHGRSDVWLIYLVAGAYGLSGQVYRAARGGLLHSMFSAEQLGDANGVLSSLSQGTRIAGPLIGAGLYAAWGIGVMIIADVATFAISVASYLALRKVPDLIRPARDAAPERQPRADFGRALVAGVRHVTANPVIRRMILASSVAFAGAGLINVAVFSLVSQGLHRSTSILGVLTSIEGAGSVLASVAVAAIMRRIGEYSTACIGYLLNGVGLAVTATASLTGAIAGMFLLGVGLPMILVAEVTLVQRRTPAELQGRALSASDAMITTPLAIATAIGVAIISTVGFRPIYLGVAAGFTVVGLALLPYRSITRPAKSSAEPGDAQDPALAEDPALAQAAVPVQPDPG